ncbi:uncharacterized protein [Cicer arietinum]|uniref:Uncharacterized protein LOC101509881 n=1 Tax=Cicer arietinum TaxID=3827 RepID=A0A1S2XJM2_CICAR|nr:uncharacterized protein LOC101509881 [Cicer arietinum]XP_004489623.1 uncharacterized protein LOC101510198 [Cicer arietinum]
MSRFSLIAIVFLLSVASSYAAKVKVVDVATICKQSYNATYCLELFKSKPSGVKGDLVSLAQYATDVLRTKITKAVDLINKLSSSTSDPAAKEYYDNCYVDFGPEGALSEVSAIQTQLKKGDYANVDSGASFIMTDVGDCFPEDFTDTSLIQKYVGEVTDIAQIIRAVTHFLTS